MLHQKVLFNSLEIDKIRGYVTKLQDRVIGTYHPDVNDGNHDPQGGHNLAEHLPWTSDTKYDWVNKRILGWVNELNLPILSLGWEFIIQKYTKGFELIGIGPASMIFFLTPTAQFFLGLYYFNEPLIVDELIVFIFIWLAVIIYLNELRKE